MNKKRKADLYLIIFCLLAALVCYLLFTFSNSKGDKVVVRVDGIITNTYSLSDDGTYSLNNGSNILVIKEKKAYLIESDCPDKLCVKQGKISKCNQCITCLPNKLTVTIESNNSDVDIIS